MRPLRLELEGFTVYKKKQVIDFEKLSFFVIQGKTGAGKTSIVDAITFALYGKVPRYGDARDTTLRVMSKGANRMKVALDFSVGGRRFKIERFYSIKPKEDIVRVEEEGRRLNLKKAEVPKWVEEVTGLDYRTFTRVILLPQGEFDRLLKPKQPKERREILVSLLNLEIFEKVRRLAQDIYKEIEGKLEALRSEEEGLEGLNEDTLRELEGEKVRLEEELKTLKEEIRALEERLRRAEEKRALEEELEHILNSLSDLRSRGDDLERKKVKLEKVRKVLPFIPYLERVESIEKQQRDMRLQKEKLLKKIMELQGELENIESERSRVEAEFSRLPQLKEELQEVVRLLERLERVAEDIREIEEGRRRLSELKETFLNREILYKECEERLSKGERMIKEVEEELKEANFDEEEYENLLKEAEKRKVLLEEERRLKDVEETLLRKRAEKEKLKKKVKDLRRRLEDREEKLKEESVAFYAYHIRTHLKEGDPCPVCGGVFKGSLQVKDGADIGRIEEEVKALREELLTLEKRLSFLESEVSALESEREKLLSKLREAEDLLKKDVEGKLSELEGKKRRKKELEDRLKKFQKRFRELLLKKEESLRELDRIRSEIELLEVTLKDKEEKVGKLSGGKTSREGIEEELDRLRRKKRDLESKISDLEEERERINSYREELTRGLVALNTKLREVEASLEKADKEKKENLKRLSPLFEEFGDLNSIKELWMPEEDVKALEREVEEFESKLRLLENRRKELENKLGEYPGERSPEDLKKELEALRRDTEAKLERVGELKGEIEQVREKLKRKEELRKEISALEKELRVYGRIREDLKSDRLQDFAASLMLKRIVERASDYLFNFTGNYELIIDERGDLAVRDRTQGVERDVKSLSGGETFLASLSLALGVSDVLSADAHLESLFIDEGFGSLDEETRERVSDMLELIKQRINRMVGIISHIPDLAERFHQRVIVKKHGDFSTVEVLI